jgi:hypothetical protein
MQDPSFNHSRPFFGCFIGTFSPSRRHRRSIRLSLTCHPASLSNAAILRYPLPSRMTVTPPARSCPPQGVFHPRGPVVVVVAWNGAGQVRDKYDVPTGSIGYAHDQCKPDDARGLEVSPCGLGQDQLIQSQIRNGSS